MDRLTPLSHPDHALYLSHDRVNTTFQNLLYRSHCTSLKIVLAVDDTEGAVAEVLLMTVPSPIILGDKWRVGVVHGSRRVH